MTEQRSAAIIGLGLIGGSLARDLAALVWARGASGWFAVSRRARLTPSPGAVAFGQLRLVGVEPLARACGR